MEKNNNLWDEFDKMIDTAGLAADIKEAEENGVNYKDVPQGKYEVELNKLELTKSKKDDPMVTAWFKIVSGDFKGSMIFMNQLVNQGFQIGIVNEILRDLAGETEIEIPKGLDEFSYKKYGELLMDIHEAVNGNFEFVLDYGENKKGFNTFKIEQIFTLD